MSTSEAYTIVALAMIERRWKEAAMYHGGIRHVIAVCLHGVRGELHVVEHALEFHSELKATLNLELGEHSTLCVIRDRSVVKEALCEMGFIITLKDILFCDEPEQGDGFVEDDFDFSIRFLRVRS
jgi:hypothetical protein